MVAKELLFHSFSQKHFSPKERSFSSWIVIFGFILLTTAFYFTGSAIKLRLIFPATAFLVAIFLYLRHSIIYIGFTWWIWFLTPLFTRLVDYKVGWDPTRQMLIAPYLVVFISIATFFKCFPNSIRQGGLPFVLSSVGVLYAFLVGMIYNQPIPVIRGLLDWLSPIIFSFHLYMNWRDYPYYRRHMQRVFILGVLVIGTYGIYQFVIAPDWDRYWLTQSGMFSSAGSPRPFGMRVWSTLHSVGPFATVMQTGLMLLFTTSGPLIFPAAIVGYISFLLSEARTNWGGWLIGIIMIMGSVKARIQMRLIMIIVVMSLCVAPLLTIEPISSVVATRFSTFANLQDDSSMKDRSGNYNRTLSIALSNILGNGIGDVWKVDEKTGQIEVFVIDSGILDTFFTLGWLGAIPYLGGLFLMINNVLSYREARSDSFMSTSRAIGVSIFLEMIMNSSMLSISGMILWGFLAMTMSAHKYYRHLKTNIAT